MATAPIASIKPTLERYTILFIITGLGFVPSFPDLIMIRFDKVAPIKISPAPKSLIKKKNNVALIGGICWVLDMFLCDYIGVSYFILANFI